MATDLEKDFTSRIQTTVANGFTTVGLAIGHEHGFWTSLATQDSPITSQQMADLTNCKER